MTDSESKTDGKNMTLDRIWGMLNREALGHIKGMDNITAEWLSCLHSIDSVIAHPAYMDTSLPTMSCNCLQSMNDSEIKTDWKNMNLDLQSLWEYKSRYI